MTTGAGWLCFVTLLVYVLRMNHANAQRFIRDRDAYRLTLFNLMKVPTAPFIEREKSGEIAEAAAREPTFEDFERQWNHLDQQAFDAFCHGLYEELGIRDREDALAEYRRRHGAMSPFEALKI
jgi:hypothetical protein